MEQEEHEESDEEGSEYEDSGSEEEEQEKERESLESQIAQYEITIKKAFKAKKIAEEVDAVNELGIL